MLLLLFLLSLGGSLCQHSEYDLHVPTSVTVQEGLCINILCNFSHPQTTYPFATGSWFKEGANIYKENPMATNDPIREVQEKSRGRFHLTGNPLQNNCSLRITDARRGDSGKYFFRIMRGLNLKYNYKTKLNLNVRALTKKPFIYIPETLEEDQPVTLLCGAFWMCREGTPPTFSWIGTSVSSQGLSQDSPYFSKLSLMPKLQDHGTNLTCQMTFPGANVSTEITVQLSVNSRARSGASTFFIGFFLGSGIMAVLAFFVNLACVRFLRRKKKDPDFQDRKKMNCISQVPGGVILDEQQDSRLPNPSPATKAPSEELYYASIKFGKSNS